MANESVYFYGRFASAPKRELERLARERGFRVAASLNETLDVVVLGEDESIGDARAFGVGI
jgi:NAD-dependent DNA ligase